MSKIARFSYKNVCTIFPAARDEWNNSTTYGDPYLIDCSFSRVNGTATDERGNELTDSLVVFTEMMRNMQPQRVPEQGDKIIEGDALADPDAVNRADTITGVVMWEMAMFNDVPDYKIYTGDSAQSKL